MNFLRHLRAFFSHPGIALVGGACCLVLSAGLIRAHAVSLRMMREETLPLLSQTASLEKRLALLTRQVSATRLSKAAQNGSVEEKLRAYVLPAGGTDRAVAVFNAAFDALQKSGKAKDIAPLTVGDPSLLSGSGTQIESRPLSVALTIREDGMQDLLAMLNASGLLTVHDLLPARDRRDFFSVTEAGNPSSIVTVGQFLSADLLQYLSDPRGVEERLLAQFPSDAFAGLLHHLSRGSTVKNAQAFLTGGIGKVMIGQKLWPMPFFMIDRAEAKVLPEGWVRLDLKVLAYGRKS